MKKIFEIALGIVTSIGGFLDVGAIATALAYEKWLSDRIITRIPGANHGE